MYSPTEDAVNLIASLMTENEAMALHGTCTPDAAVKKTTMAELTSTEHMVPLSAPPSVLSARPVAGRQREDVGPSLVDQKDAA